MPRMQNTMPAAPGDMVAGIRPAPEEIATRAFDLYQRRGATHGGDLDDWLEAERQLVQERRERMKGN